MASTLSRVALAVALTLPFGCTVVSGVSELEIESNGGDGTTASCETCTDSSECLSANCRVIECVSGSRPTICLPDGATEQTAPETVGCDWAAVCP